MYKWLTNTLLNTAKASMTLSIIGAAPQFTDNIPKTALVAGSGIAGGMIGGGVVVLATTKRDRHSLKNITSFDESVRSLQSEIRKIDTIQESVKDFAKTQYQLSQKVNGIPNQLQQKFQDRLSEFETLHKIMKHLVNEQQQIRSDVVDLVELVKGFQSNTTNKFETSSQNSIHRHVDLIARNETTGETGDEPESELELDDVQEAIAWLETNRVNVESHRQLESKIDIRFNDIAVFLGKHFNHLEPLYRRIKQSLRNHTDFRLSLKDDPHKQRKISLGTQFCRKLKDAAILSSPRYYFSNEKFFRGSLHPEPDVINFFNGSWFEYFIADQVIDLLNRRDLNYQYLRNLTVSSPNSDSFEIDLFFLIEGKPLWIECKAGADYDSSLRTYSQRRELLSLSQSSSLLVVLDLDEDLAEIRTERYGITVANREIFLQKIEKLLDSVDEFDPLEDQADQIEQIDSHDPSILNIEAFKKVQPVPEYRSIIIGSLIKLFEDTQKPRSCNQIKSILAKQLAKVGVSGKKIEAILKVILRSKCFLDKDGKPVSSFSKPVTTLKSLDPAWIEGQCIERYAKQVLLYDPNFFGQPNNMRQFENFIGGRAPEEGTINALKSRLNNSQDSEENSDNIDDIE
ncbi:MAG: hypothetical protein ACFE0J_12295 [Elainellaceae cyanobacterium]